jgi:ABC-type lipoprotein export system ATPase subunit
VIVVTHDEHVAAHTHRIVRLLDGKVESDEVVEAPLIAGTPQEGGGAP